MIKKDYYEVLGIDRNADDATIKKTYRKKAYEFHPDRNSSDPQAEEKFKEASEAYEVLHDPEKRSLYDRFGHEGLRRSGFGGFQGFEDIFSSFGDVFEEFFGFGGSSGRGQKRDHPHKGADLRYDMEIEFMEAARGMEKEIEVEKYATCKRCGGNRSEQGKKATICPTCQGTGSVTRSQGFFAISSACPQCRGEGVKITHPCKQCGGMGQVLERKKLSVRTPAGVDTGSRLRLRGEGEPGRNGGPPGDLYIALHVRQSELFERHGDDIVVKAPVTFAQAALGAEIKIPSLEGETDLSIPAGVQPNTLIRLEGMGIAHLNSYGRGDLVAVIIVKTPEKLDKQREELFRKLAELEGSSVRAHQKGFFEKLMK